MVMARSSCVNHVAYAYHPQLSRAGATRTEADTQLGCKVSKWFSVTSPSTTTDLEKSTICWKKSFAAFHMQMNKVT